MTIQLNHHILAARDAKRCARFFIDILGFAPMDSGDEGWQFVTRDELIVMIGHCPGSPEARELGNHSLFAYWVVDDVDAWYEQVLAAGGSPTCAPQNEAWGMREFGLATPEGHRLTIGTRIAAKVS